MWITTHTRKYTIHQTRMLFRSTVSRLINGEQAANQVDGNISIGFRVTITALITDCAALTYSIYCPCRMCILEYRV